MWGLSLAKPLFQSLKGFQRLWSRGRLSRSYCTNTWVSIPKRVSEALKRYTSRNAAYVNMFQSLKGFQRLWSSQARAATISRTEFQSLKGFQRLWSLQNLVFSFALKGSTFQSLKGFQRLWSFRGNWGRGGRRVSIPKRVSEALKRYRHRQGFTNFKFQSLKGFQRLWSGGDRVVQAILQSFNP